MKSAPVPQDNAKNRYAFIFPFAPARLSFKWSITVPYTGSANIDPKAALPAGTFRRDAAQDDAVHAPRRQRLSSHANPGSLTPTCEVAVEHPARTAAGIQAFRQGSLAGDSAGDGQGERTAAAPLPQARQSSRRRPWAADRRSRSAGEISLVDSGWLCAGPGGGATWRRTSATNRRRGPGEAACRR